MAPPQGGLHEFQPPYVAQTCACTGGNVLRGVPTMNDQTRLLTLTPAAVAEAAGALTEFGEQGECLRVSTYPAGGRQQYGLAFDRQRPGDVVISFDGLTVLVDPESARRLRGTVVDFGAFATGTGF